MKIIFGRKHFIFEGLFWPPLSVCSGKTKSNCTALQLAICWLSYNETGNVHRTRFLSELIAVIITLTINEPPKQMASGKKLSSKTNLRQIIAALTKHRLTSDDCNKLNCLRRNRTRRTNQQTQLFENGSKPNLSYQCSML